MQETKIISVLRKYAVIDNRCGLLLIKFGESSDSRTFNEGTPCRHGGNLAPTRPCCTSQKMAIVFGEYYNLGVSFAPEDLSMFKVCHDEYIV